MLTIVCMVLCAVTGCQKKEKEKEVIEFEGIVPEEVPVILRDENYVPQTLESEPETEEETETEEVVEPFCDKNQITYQVKVQTFQQGNISIEYPEVTDMDDDALMNRINGLIQQQLIPEDILEDEAILSYEVSCEIATQGTGVLSFVCRGYEEYEGAAHPSQFVRTLNIDMTNGCNIRLKDYADIEAIVSGLELEQGYVLVESEIDMSDFSAFLNNGYITDYAMTLLDYDIDSNRPENVQAGYSYIKDNHPVLCMEVEHAMGDYVEVCFDMQIK